MNAKVKRMVFSVITAMCILALTAGTAYAACGGFSQFGYVYDKDGVKLPDCSHSVNITNLNTSVVYYWGTVAGTNTTCYPVAGGGYKLVTTSPTGAPYTDRACAWITGDVAKYEARNADGTQTNTTYFTVTDAEMDATKIILHIYLELTAAEETYSKDLPEGWNLISLPLKPTNSNTASVLSSVSQDAVYSYNATLHSFVDVSTGTMHTGIGYFVHVTAASTWTYNGVPAYTDMSTSLEPGLNMVGWLNCSKPVSDGLSSIAGNYYYVARWNVTSQSFETFNPVAPPVFNDFSDMERGEGYFISAKATGTLSESC